MEEPVNITSELKEKFDSVNKSLSDACKLALKQPILGKQFVVFSDASIRTAGYALIIGDNPDKKNSQSGKHTPLWRLAPKFSSPRNPKTPYTQMNFWQSTWPFYSLHTFSGKQQSQQFFWQTKYPSHISSKQNLFRQPFGMQVNMCCNLISKYYILLV